METESGQLGIRQELDIVISLRMGFSLFRQLYLSTRDWVAHEQTENYFSHFWRLEVQIRMSALSGSDVNSLAGDRPLTLPCIFTWWKENDLVLRTFVKGTNPIYEDSTLMT